MLPLTMDPKRRQSQQLLTSSPVKEKCLLTTRTGKGNSAMANAKWSRFVLVLALASAIVETHPGSAPANLNRQVSYVSVVGYWENVLPCLS